MIRNSLVLSLAAASVIFNVSCARAQAAQAPRINQIQAGYQHFMIGDVQVIALSDGTLPIPADKLLTNVKPGEVAMRLAHTYQTPSVDASVNAFLIKAADRLIMVDAGTGELYGPSLNKLEASLKAAGYQPSQITDILITHIHTDHTGGLMRGREMVFPNATLHIERKEVDYWLNPERRSKAPASTRKYFDEAFAKVQPYVDAGKVKTFSGETQLFPGIKTIPAPGHTPGHTLYALESKGRKLVFWGDLVHVAEVQLPRPAVTIVFDVDPKAAATTRKRVLAEAHARGDMIAADHVAFPGIGHVQVDGEGYRWIPAPYVNDFYEAR
jgi:glyoxylase-like metal-dependent hydrolase (beta-lactamase superfamily II)